MPRRVRHCTRRSCILFSLILRKVHNILLMVPHGKRLGRGGFTPERLGHILPPRPTVALRFEDLWMTLEEIKRLVTCGHFRYSEKIRESIEDGLFEEEDLVHSVLSATEIQKKERDERREAVHRMKYVILGRDVHGRLLYTVGKVVQRPDGQLYSFITARQADEGS